ncbi:MAG TPA: DUF177 domain-containing protein [Alphaproteobacteria bacterium]|jgi:uncharacterized metal-binding protein YceD (DUF177 family)|nr:DUF177 domain-containing protein [Alphaproteobacteria bacterium]
MTELSRPLAVTDIGNEPMLFEVVADADERTALARRFDLHTLESLTGRLAVRRTTARDGSGEAVRVRIDLDAAVVQRCIATLEPVAATLSETGVEVEFALNADSGQIAREIAFTLDDTDPPEPLADDSIDIGELLAQHLALAIDPYPRSPGAALDLQQYEEAATSESPFSPLAQLRDAKD